MRISSRMLLSASTILIVVVGLWSLPGMAQEPADSSQAAPNLTGTGNAGRIAVWKNSTTLGNSVLSQSAGNVGIGTAAPTAKLEVNGDAQVDGALSLSGNILVNGVGPLLQAPNNGSYNLSAGLNALSPATTGTYDTAVGDSALYSNTNGYSNTAIGTNALFFNTTGFQNTASGTGALSSNTTSPFNTAIGAYALASNTTGYGDTASGASALLANTTGGGNVASGASALLANTTGGGNTASGYAALNVNTTGSDNTAVGHSALFNTNGDDNTAVGYYALYNNTGATNIALGSYAGQNVTAGSNNIDIGSSGTAIDNGTIRIGTPYSSSNQAGQTSAFIAGIYGSSTGLANVNVVVDANGNLGTIQSSRRYKEDIKDMGNASEGLMNLRPVIFRYKKAYENGSKPVQYGLIAEEVAEVYPDLVARSADGQIETVKYQLLDSMLLNELQKQHATITAQQEQIRSLEERLARIEAALSGTSVTAAAR